MENKKAIFTDIWDDRKTDYSITNEHGEKSTIRLSKWAADILQQEKKDVHLWVQDIYGRVCEKHPDLSRRQKGNFVRVIAETEAQKSSHFVALSDFL